MGLFLSLLIFFSGFLRGAYLPHTPPELFGDEIDVGYQAISLFKTGADLYNQSFPAYIHSLAEWRAPLLIYATVPTIAVFGNNVWGVRLPEVIFGSIAPLILFLFVYYLSRSRLLAVFSALSLAVMPWHIIYSRAAYEVVILLDLLMIGSLLYTRRRYTLSLIFLSLCIYTYSTAVVFIPLWFVALLLLSRRRPTVISCIPAVILLLPFIFSLVTGHAQERFGRLSIYPLGQDTIGKILQLRQESGSPLERLFYNQPEAVVAIFSTNYLRAFSSDFLFVRGDPTFRQSIQIIGELLPVTAPLLLLGLYYLAKKREWLWLVWLVLAPIPASLTVDGSFHATRLFLMVTPLSVILGAGMVQCWQLLRPRFRPLGLMFIWGMIGAQLVFVGHYYLVHYPKLSWRWWQVGFADAYTVLNRESPKYSHVYINNSYEPSLIRFLFYADYPPALFHQQFKIDQPQPSIAPEYDGFNLGDKYTFGSFTTAAHYGGIQNYFQPNSLYVISQRDDLPLDRDWRIDPPVGVKVIYTSVNPYNQPVFYLVSRI